MAQGDLRISGWLTTIAVGTAIIKIGKTGVFVRICRHSSLSSDFVSGKHAK
jgi:hypothetical protein